MVLPPQAAALALGAVIDTVVPSGAGEGGGPNWRVSPVLVATLVCDHRVVDGAVAAQWLQAYKELVENPLTMFL